WLTGGDAQRLAPELRRQGLQPRLAPDLALDALAALAAALCWTLASTLWRRLPTSLTAARLNLLKNVLALLLLSPALALLPGRSITGGPLLLLA
ncbi:hypothetical protein, partial [Escherichia coli]|uniref:hypothetical protein n=1 Tax=Escherichia coli TaxID=562 RepID=UPI00201085E5